MNHLQINILEKKFGDKIVLKEVSLSINSNGVYGVIGKNGAGKTTLFKSILKETKYDGKINFNEQDVLYKKVGYCPTDPFLYDELSVKEFYEFYFYITNNQKLILSDHQLLYDVDVTKSISSLSTGMRKKVFLNSLFFQKEIDFYIFDEPFNGLDIESNLILIKKIKELAKDKIVLISSHILSSMYDFCDQIFLVHNQSIVSFQPEKYSDLEEYFI